MPKPACSLKVACFPIYLVDEQHDDVLDNLDEVNEELEGVSNEVVVASAFLEDDHLSVPHHEAAEHGKANPHVKLKENAFHHLCSFLKPLSSVLDVFAALFGDFFGHLLQNSRLKN